jgi:uncharacterized membrane protein YeaQ/YmgE (transglycosylase-associated protein family)
MLGIIGWIVFGFVVGLIARAILPGRDEMGFVATTLLGIIGAVIGGYVGRFLGWYATGEAAGLIVATLGAIVVLASYNAVIRGRIARKRVTPPGATAPEKPRKIA